MVAWPSEARRRNSGRRSSRLTRALAEVAVLDGVVPEDLGLRVGGQDVAEGAVDDARGLAVGAVHQEADVAVGAFEEEPRVGTRGLVEAGDLDRQFGASDQGAFRGERGRHDQENACHQQDPPAHHHWRRRFSV